MTVLTIVSDSIHPTAVVGLSLLVLYVLLSEYDREDAADPSPSIADGWAWLGIGVATLYVGFTLALWVNPNVVGSHVDGFVTGASRLVYGSPAVAVLDPVAVRAVETDVRAAVATLEETLLRSPGRPVRWPFYLFISYLSISELADVTGWWDRSARPVRVAGQATTAVIVLLYGLVLAHNFFPGPDSLPWRSTTITVWLLSHTAVSAVVSWLLRRATQSSPVPSITASLVVFLLLGMGIAVLDGLSPLPELLILGVAAVVLVGRFFPVSWADTRTIQLADIEGRVVDSLATAWQRPTRLFPLLVVFQGFWWGGQLLWLLVFSVGAPLSGTTQLPPLTLVLVVLLFLPLVVAAVHSLAFWFQELQRLSSSTDTATPVAPRLPDLLAAPTLVVGSYLLAGRLSGVHPLAGLLAVLGVLAGVVGMYWSVRTARSDRELPWPVDHGAVPVGFLLQAGGFTLASLYAGGGYGTSGSPPLLLLGTLGPLSFYPRVRADGVGALSSTSASVLLVGGVTAFATGYLLSVGELSLVNGGFLSITAVVLALQNVARDAGEWFRTRALPTRPFSGL